MHRARPITARLGATALASFLRTILRVLHTISLLVFSSSLYLLAFPQRLLFLSEDEQLAATRLGKLMSRELSLLSLFMAIV